MDKKIKDINFDDLDLSKFQEEIEELNKQCEKFLKRRSIKRILRKYKIKDLEEENKLLRELIEKIKLNPNEILCLSKENKKLQKRIDKAIKKLKIVKPFNFDMVGRYEVLDILEGSDIDE